MFDSVGNSSNDTVDEVSVTTIVVDKGSSVISSVGDIVLKSVEAIVEVSSSDVELVVDVVSGSTSTWGSSDSLVRKTKTKFLSSSCCWCCQAHMRLSLLFSVLDH